MEHQIDPHQLLTDTTFAVFDVETTGLSPTYGHRVCEIGCLRVRDGLPLDRLQSLVDPGRPISPGAYNVNRITPQMLIGAPAFAALSAPLLRIIEGTVLVAHNAPFDLGFLAAELEIARLPLPRNPVLDTLALARRAYNLPRNNLAALATALDVEANPTHRAMADVWTTFCVLERLLRDLEHRWAITTLGELVRFQGGPIPFPDSSALPLPPAIADALAHGGRVRMRYVDARGHETHRTVRPMRVSARRDNLYLIAHCYRRDALRTFRLDRVLELVLEDELENL
jgi:DNA polymerase III epsilon subunit family exonuclease